MQMFPWLSYHKWISWKLQLMRGQRVDLREWANEPNGSIWPRGLPWQAGQMPVKLWGPEQFLICDFICLSKQRSLHYEVPLLLLWIHMNTAVVNFQAWILPADDEINCQMQVFQKGPTNKNASKAVWAFGGCRGCHKYNVEAESWASLHRRSKQLCI